MLSNSKIAKLLLEVIFEIDSDLTVYGLAGSTLAESCKANGLQFAHEAFGDRRYESATELRSRTKRDALIETEADFCNHVGQLVAGTVTDIHGETHILPVQTICLHSDTPNATNFARLAHEILNERNNPTDAG